MVAAGVDGGSGGGGFFDDAGTKGSGVNIISRMANGVGYS